MACLATRFARAANETTTPPPTAGRGVVVLAGDEGSPQGRGLVGRRASDCNGRDLPGLDHAADPGIGERGDILFFDDEVPCQGKPVELGLRQPPPEVGREPEVEDRVTFSPHEQHGGVELRHVRGHLRHGGEGPMERGRRNVLDELEDRALLSRLVGRARGSHA